MTGVGVVGHLPVVHAFMTRVNGMVFGVRLGLRRLLLSVGAVVLFLRQCMWRGEDR